MQLLCAHCQRPGAHACSKCRLVVYCGRQCQEEHWKVHRIDCKSTLVDPAWEPDWVKENRSPAFIRPELTPMTPFGSKKFLWGNLPAIDILQLPANEGSNHQANLNVLFAASGDMRNLVKTMADLPAEYQRPTMSVMNDLDFDVVARNAIMLLLMLLTEDREQASTTALHIWYSALVREADLDILANTVRPLIENVVHKISTKDSDSLQAKTWKINKSSLRLVLTQEQWSKLLRFLDVPANVDGSVATEVRASVTMAPLRKDYVQRSLILQQPYHRVCKMRFREDGVLLPFGHSRESFVIPNPTFFQAASWPMMDSAESCGGWSFPDISATPSGTASNDIYAKLYIHVKDHLMRFHERANSTGLDLELHNRHAAELPSVLKAGSFARIETSNIADLYYMGAKNVVERLIPLLQTPTHNRHAMLMTTFMNAVQEEQSGDERKSTQTEMPAVLKYLPLSSFPRHDPPNAAFMVMQSGMNIVRDGDHYFDRYMKRMDFDSLGRAAGARVKAENTIVEKWPMRVKRKAGQPGAEEEFRMVLASCHTGVERYVEWVRTA